MDNKRQYTQEEIDFYNYQQTKIKNQPAQLQGRLSKAKVAEAKRENRKAERDRIDERLEYLKRTTPKYRQCFEGARKRDLVFNLSVEQFTAIVEGTVCVYCGTGDKIGVDRIDSLYGYIPDNVQPCCTACNIMKRTYSHEDFVSIIYRIHSYLNR